MSDDFIISGAPDPDEFEYDEQGYLIPRKPKRDDPRKPKGRSFDWIEVWTRAVTKPDVSVYREHLADPLVSATRGLTWMFAAFVVGSVLQAVSNSIASSTGTSLWGASEVTFSLTTALCCAPFAAVFAIIMFVIFNGIQFVVASLLGGKGSFNDQLYSVASYAAPMSLIMSGVGMIPCLGPVVVLGIALYTLYLNVVALEAVHLFDRGRALITSLAWVLLLCLCPVAIIVMLVLTGPAIGNTFQNIIDELITPTPSVVWALRFLLAL